MSASGSKSGPNPPSEASDPEFDLLERYDRMIQTQIATLEGIDEKAASVARLVGGLAGLLLSGVSIAVSAESIALSRRTGPVFLSLGVAGVALFCSLLYAIITYLSSEFEYGPSSKLGVVMATAAVDEQQYRNVLLGGYSHAIERNETVVRTNARRFQRCLAAFLAGLLALFAAGTVLVLQVTPWVEAAVLLAIGGIGWRLLQYVLREEYLTLDREPSNDE